MILLLLLKMITVNLSDLIKSRYKIIHQIMYKMKDKKQKKRMKVQCHDVRLSTQFKT